MRKRLSEAFSILLFLGTPTLSAQNAADSLRAWSGLERVKLADLAAGKIITTCNASMKFARGISTKSAYVVLAPVSVTADILLNTDPSKDAEREVFQHRFFQAEADAAFSTINLD